MSKSKNNNNFLVYMYMRKDGTPYYVGKGRPKRPYTKGGRPCNTPTRDRIVIYRENLDEKTAFQLERELIAKYGRKDIGTGILHNRSDGGEGPSGYRHSEKARKIMSEKSSGKNHPKYTPRDWYHPIYGEVLQKSASDLIEMFPEQKLSSSCLSAVSSERLFHNKGWRLLKNRDVQYELPKNVLRDWYHPKHGEITGKSVSDLMEMFPEENLNNDKLVAVANGKAFHTKEWRLLKNKYSSYKSSVNLWDWYHPEHGELKGISIPSLLKKFPGENLIPSSLTSVTAGKILQHKRWRLLKNKNLKRRSSRRICRNWYHPEFGEVLNTSISELIEMFPNQKLKRGLLSRVSSGKILQYKNWRSLERKDEIYIKPEKGKLWDWYHPIYGHVPQTSISKLIEMFPNQKLAQACLGRLTRDEKKSYKDWMVSPKPLKAREKSD